MNRIDSSIENPFHNFIPVLSIALIWILFLLVVIIFYSFSKPSEKWSKPLYYKCNTRSAQFLYVFRLIVETPTKRQDFGDSSLTIKLLDSENRTLFEIVVDSNSLKIMDQFSAEEPNKSIVRFFVHTSSSLQNMETIVLNLKTKESNGYIKVFNVEIQEINGSDANVAQVGQDIKQMKLQSASENQSFFISSQRRRVIEDSVVSSRLLNSYEYILFVWFAINLIAMFPSFLIVCTGEHLLCDDYNFDWLSSVYTGLTAICWQR